MGEGKGVPEAHLAPPEPSLPRPQLPDTWRSRLGSGWGSWPSTVAWAAGRGGSGDPGGAHRSWGEGSRAACWCRVTRGLGEGKGLTLGRGQRGRRLAEGLPYGILPSWYGEGLEQRLGGEQRQWREVLGAGVGRAVCWGAWALGPGQLELRRCPPAVHPCLLPPRQGHSTVSPHSPQSPRNPRARPCPVGGSKKGGTHPGEWKGASSTYHAGGNPPAGGRARRVRSVPGSGRPTWAGPAGSSV